MAFAATIVGAMANAQVEPPAAVVPTAAQATKDDPALTSVLERTIALRLDNVSVRNALDSIATLGHVQLSYTWEQVPASLKVSLTSDRITIGEALHTVLAATTLYPVPLSPVRIALVPSTASKSSSMSQQGTAVVSGYVRDSATGAGIRQVTVRIDGTTLEVRSNADGQYKITGIAAGEYRITARRVGYLATTRAVTLTDGQNKVVDFALNPPATKLDEVVTTALGAQRRYEVGNVISTINIDSIAPTAPVTSVTDLLSARVPGLDIIENSGLVGSGNAIRIRGVSSLVLQNDPIIIVDGIREDNTAGGASPLYVATAQGYGGPSRINDINFDDIATIDVLKGPAATTEYGTDAANGVIVITTKRGVAGTTMWHVDGEQTMTGVPTDFPKHYYSWGHLTDGTGAQAVSGVPQYNSSGYNNCRTIPAPSNPLYPVVTKQGQVDGTCVLDSITEFNPLNDRYTSIFGNGDRQKYDLSVSGGSEAVRYFLEGGMSNETGIVRLPPAFRSIAAAQEVELPSTAFDPNFEQQRSARLNTQMRLNSTTDLAVNVGYMSTVTKTPNALGLFDAINNSPALDNAANDYGYNYFDGSEPYYSPIATTTSIAIDNTTQMTGGVTLNWRPTGWFTGHAILGIDHGSDAPEQITFPLGAVGTPGGNYSPYPSLSLGDGGSDIYTIDLRASAIASLMTHVRATTSAGLQLADSRSTGQVTTSYNITPQDVSLQGGTDYGYQLATTAVTLGGYGEEQISIADRLFLIGALRMDAASGFGSSYVVATYPKASFSWLAVDASQATVRLRGAFGAAGQPPEAGASTVLFQSQQQGYVAGVSVPSQSVEWPGNQNLRPERSQEFEGGLDIGAWGNRVSLELTAYQKTTHDALINAAIGGDVGNWIYEENLGDVENGGIEAQASFVLLATRQMDLSVTVNGSINHNKLLHIAQDVLLNGSGPFNGTYADPNELFAVNYPLYGYWAYPVRYNDANHDGIIESDEVSVGDTMQYVGTSAPTRQGSLAIHLGVLRHALTVSGLFVYQGGYRVENLPASQLDYIGSSYEANFLNAPLWEQARVATPNPGYICCIGSETANLFEDGTFIRLREVSLTYAVPRDLLRGLRVFDNLTITGAARNLFLWTRYSGLDPETGYANAGNVGVDPVSNGLNATNDVRADEGNVPLLRTFVVRLNLGLK